MLPGELIPIIGMLTGIVTTGFLVWGLVKIGQGPIGQALARWILSHAGSGNPELQAEVSFLREQVEALHGQMNETQERLDFTERLLARARTSGSLPEAH